MLEDLKKKKKEIDELIGDKKITSVSSSEPSSGATAVMVLSTEAPLAEAESSDIREDSPRDSPSDNERQLTSPPVHMQDTKAGKSAKTGNIQA